MRDRTDKMPRIIEKPKQETGVKPQMQVKPPEKIDEPVILPDEPDETTDDIYQPLPEQEPVVDESDIYLNLDERIAKIELYIERIHPVLEQIVTDYEYLKQSSAAIPSISNDVSKNIGDLSRLMTNYIEFKQLIGNNLAEINNKLTNMSNAIPGFVDRLMTTKLEQVKEKESEKDKEVQ